jgi:hypothetical protein
MIDALKVEFIQETPISGCVSHLYYSITLKNPTELCHLCYVLGSSEIKSTSCVG